MGRVAVLELVQYNDATSSYKKLIEKNLDRMENAADLAKENVRIYKISQHFNEVIDIFENFGK